MEPPNLSNFGAVTSSTINYTTGCLNLPNEHGIILYYNISATVESSSYTTFYTANVTTEKCITNPSCFANTNLSCPSTESQNLSPELYLTSQNCSYNRTRLTGTSSVVYHILDQLKYWTIYNISAAACTRKGCGPFGGQYSIRTDEHSPTCFPNATEIQNTSSTSLLAKWLEIPVSCAHGVVLYYNVFISPEEDLTGDECFDNATCWANQTSGSTKFSLTTRDLWFEFNELKKYKRYCVFLQAVNSKGRGPASYGICNYTAEDGKLYFGMIERWRFYLLEDLRTRWRQMYMRIWKIKKLKNLYFNLI